MNEQELPKLEFWFDYFACIWIDGAAAKVDTLPITPDLLNELNALIVEYADQIDWDDPGSSVGWTEEQKEDFNRRAAIAGKKLQEELQGKYTVINCFEDWL